MQGSCGQPDTPLPRGPSAQLRSPPPLAWLLTSFQFLSDYNKLQTISGLASSYPNLEQTMSSPAHGGTLTGRKFHLLTTLKNPDKTAAELGSCSQPFVAVTRDSLFSEDGEGEAGGDSEGAESSSNTQENNRRMNPEMVALYTPEMVTLYTPECWS